MQGLEGIDAIRERYITILEQEVLVPLKKELTERHEIMLRHLDAADAEDRAQAEREAAQLPQALALIDDITASLRWVRLTHLRALLGGAPPKW